MTDDLIEHTLEHWTCHNFVANCLNSFKFWMLTQE